MVEVLMWRDDITGELGAEPYHFAVRGCVVDIDLTPDNQAALLNALAPFIQAGRITSKPGAVPSEIRAILNGAAPAIEAPTNPAPADETEPATVQAAIEYSVLKEAPAIAPSPPKPPAKKPKPKRKGIRSFDTDRAHTAKERREIAEWIRLHRIPNVAPRGRKPADVWDAFLAKDLTKLADKHRPPALRAAIGRAG